MKNFIFSSPFPFDVQEEYINPLDTYLGPYTFSEAVEVFWNLQKLEIVLESNARVAYNDESEDNVFIENNDKYFSDIPDASCYAHFEPYTRGRRVGTYYLYQIPEGVAPHNMFNICRPVLLPSSANVSFAEREFAFPLMVYFGNTSHILSSSICYGDDEHLDLMGLVPITILGKTTNLFLTVNKLISQPDENQTSSHNAFASVNVFMHQ